MTHAIIVLGGASRCGKGIIAQELMRQINVPHLSIDPIKMALSRAVQAYPLDTNGSSVEVASALWPFLSALILNCVETGVPYIVEGEILPHHVHELSDRYGIAAVSCFIGYRNIDVQCKVDLIQRYSGYPNDWTGSLSDSELAELVTAGIKYSQYLHNECLKYGLRYVDFSDNFEESKEEVMGIILAAVRQEN